MSELIGRVYPSELAARRAIARGDWIARVQASSLDAVTKSVLTDPRNLEAWWPNPHRDQKGAAA